MSKAEFLSKLERAEYFRDFRLRAKEAEEELSKARALVERFRDLHHPAVKARRRRYEEDPDGWSLMLGSAVSDALALYPQEVECCHVCDGKGVVTCDCGDEEHACGGGEEVACGNCDGDGEEPQP